MNNKLSIVCITYNQENFIKQALDSFLEQKTDFDFEVIISDDCSTDGTAKILKEYEEKYPNIFKIFYQEKNIGAIKNFIFSLSQAKSEYVIVNEGDDYFIDPCKLQKQVDFLEAHPEYSGCFHPVKVIWENGEKKESIYPTAKKMFGKKFVTKEDLLDYNYIQTNSVLYRWRFVNEDINNYFPDDIIPADIYLHLLHAQVGNIAFLPETMAVYRRHDAGIWFNKDPKGYNIYLKYGLQKLKCNYSIWKNITNNSEKYYERRLVPFFKFIIDIYLKFGKFDELKIIYETYPEIYEKAINYEEKKPKRFLGIKIPCKK